MSRSVQQEAGAGRLALLAALASFALATLTLDWRSLWGDEAFSVWASKQSLLALWGGLDAQPPLYHTLLAGARLLWGESVFALRFLSVLSAVLLVPLGFRLARLLGLRMGAVLVAWAMALAPIQLYFAQEARMYAPAALFAAIAMVVARVGALRTWRRSAAYALATLAALLMHYYAAGIVVVNAAYALWRAWRAQQGGRAVSSQLRRWVLVHGMVALLFTGWFVLFQSRYALRATRGRAQWLAPLAEIAENVPNGLRGLLLGLHVDAAWNAPVLVLFALALLGVLGYWRAWRRGDAVLVWAWSLIPLVLVTLTASRSAVVPDFHPRYYLFALLPLLLALGGWTLWSQRWVRGVAALLMLAPALGSAALFDLSWAKSRYAELIAHLQREHQTGDVLVMVNSDQFALAEYYRPPALPTWLVSNALLNDEAAVRHELEIFLRSASRVWVVNYGWAMALRPPSAVERALRERAVLVDQRGYQDAALLLFDLRVSEGGAFEPHDALFGGQIRLVGVRARRSVYRPGENVVLDLLWRAEQPPRADYTVFMHLRRADTGEQLNAFDSPPQPPTSAWAVGATITDTRAVPIPSHAPPGDYVVIVGWYLYPSFERLSLNGSAQTEYLAARVRVE